MSSGKSRSADERITVTEVEKRLRATLKGAFSGPPTQQKDIPQKGKQNRVKRAALKKRN